MGHELHREACMCVCVCLNVSHCYIASQCFFHTQMQKLTFTAHRRISVCANFMSEFLNHENFLTYTQEDITMTYCELIRYRFTI